MEKCIKESKLQNNMISIFNPHAQIYRKGSTYISVLEGLFPWQEDYDFFFGHQTFLCVSALDICFKGY